MALKYVDTDLLAARLQTCLNSLPARMEVTATSTLQLAAVLVPLIRRPAGFSVLLTRRCAHLARHAGQISFPGGCVDSTDTDYAATALRELHEEVGIERHHATVIGALDTHDTRTGFRIVPVVAMITADFHLRLAPAEVEAAFELPLQHVLDEHNHRRRAVPGCDAALVFDTIQYGKECIWGATAAILHNLRARVLEAAPEPGDPLLLPRRNCAS